MNTKSLKLFQIFTTSLLIVFLMNCQEKKVKTTYGYDFNDKKLLGGLVLNYGLRAGSTGSTVIDGKTGLEWQKCTYGQSYRSAQNDCQGTVNSNSLYSPQDQARYGATPQAYCNVPGSGCNAASLPQQLISTGSSGIFSPAFNACNSLPTNGGNAWRVPTYPELFAMASGGRASLLLYFPNTVEDIYWSSWSNETDLTGQTARGVIFTVERFGQDAFAQKDSRYYVRCVR